MAAKRRLVSAGLLIGFSFAAGLAVPARANQNWRPIPPADLALKDNPASPGSQAMILYREEYIDSTNAQVTSYYRIKIFTAEGEEYGNVEIPYDKGISGIHNLKARTILPSGRVVEFQGKPFKKMVVKTGGVKVYEDTFSFPDVQPGCIIEYQYQVQYDTDYYWSITAILEKDLFTREAHFAIRPPSGPDAPVLYTREFSFPRLVRPVKQKDGSFSFVLHDIPPLKREPYMPPAGILRGRIQFYLRKGKLKSSDEFWNAQATSWAHQLDHFLDRKGTLEKVVAEVVSPSDAPLVKLRKLYARAQQIRNTDFYPIGAPPAKSEKLKDNHNVEDVLKHGYGSAADINALFIGLARAAGFDAKWVRFADRARTVFAPKLEDTDELDSFLVVVRVDGRNVFLDPSLPDYPYGLLPWDETATDGLVESSQGAEFVNIPSTTAAEAVTERHAKLSLDAQGDLSGTLEVDFTGIRGAGIREDERGKGQSDRRQDIKKIIQRWLPSRATFQITTVTGWSHPSAPLRVEGTLKMTAYGDRVGKRLLVPLVPFVSPEASAFRPASRVNPIDFAFPFERRDDIIFQLPPGYGVEDIPKPQAIHQPPFVYTIAVAKQGNELHVTRELTINGFYFEDTYYSAIRNVFSMVKTADDNQAVLERAVAAANQ